MNPMIEAFETIEAQVLQLMDLNSALRAQCASLQAQLQEQSQAHNGLHAVSDDHQQMIAERDEAIAQRDRLIALRDQSIAEREQSIAEHQKAIAERDRQLREYRDRMNQAQQRVRKALEVLPPHTPDLFEPEPPTA